MRCQEFDAHIEELLSGMVPPEANEHMRQCERCTSYFRARTAVQNGLRNLATAPLPGPSRATDRAVMEAYRRRQQPAAATAAGVALPAAHGARLLSFPRRASATAVHASRWWGGAAAAAVAVAVLGVGMQQIHHASTAASPQSVAAAPSAAAQSGAPAAVASSAVMVASTGAEHSAPQAAESAAAPVALVASSALQSVSRRGRKGRKLSGSTRVEFASANAAQRVTAEAAAQPMLASAPSPSAQAPAGASALMHLASSGAGGPAMVAGAPPAGSTWPGYSNLMYCDPVVCSGPMPVVHIKVPVGQGAPNAQPGSSSGFVNADVVIGPDGVARAIRVAN